MSDHLIVAPDPSRQVAFHQLLVAARRTWLIDALVKAVSEIDPVELKLQLMKYVPKDAQRILAGAGVRDEHVFPTPITLKTAPTLVGYYRLLLGVPQKSFYVHSTGLALFKSMEQAGTMTPRQEEFLPAFCMAMCNSLAELIRQLSPAVTEQDIRELPLLTLGSFFQGQNNVRIGQQATTDVFLSVKEIIEAHLVEHGTRSMSVQNASGRKVFLTLATDPDIRIEEEFSEELRKKVAIEIKGGTDRSNAHNRAGEAEKSHQKAKRAGFVQFWTIISTKGLDMEKLRHESPTTNAWFDVSQVLGRQGPEWDDFRSRIVDVVGIPITKGRKRR